MSSNLNYSEHPVRLPPVTELMLAVDRQQKQRRNAVDYGTPPELQARIQSQGISSLRHARPSQLHPPATSQPFQPVYTPQGYLIYPPAARPPPLQLQRAQPIPPTQPKCPHCASDTQVEHQRSKCPTRGPAVVPDQKFTATPGTGPTCIIFESNTTKGGVALLDILGFRDCMNAPGAKILRYGLGPVPVVLHVGAVELNVKVAIPGNCAHRPITRFNLAYWIARAFRKQVANLTDLDLLSLSTADGMTWSAQARYVYPVSY
ncbi:hypothetical protein DFH07DRAFT_969951 [Mycena maculata]|uniref:Uncharacterized protein n=1 Tax=Mycena maculata TaxID=230809 RepID=A0AAD7HUW4_9AGAR|nr:hypothetical protein DFH07DRAFT_969951 [Mycena maculata]